MPVPNVLPENQARHTASSIWPQNTQAATLAAARPCGA